MSLVPMSNNLMNRVNQQRSSLIENVQRLSKSINKRVEYERKRVVLLFINSKDIVFSLWRHNVL